MIHPGEHISLAFAHHADEFYTLLSRVLRKSDLVPAGGNRIEYLRTFLHEFSHSFAAHRFGNLRMVAKVFESPVAPTFRLPDQGGVPIHEPFDLMVVVRYNRDGEIQMEKVVFHRFLMKRHKEDLWYVPRRHVDFLASFPDLEFGSTGGASRVYSPLIRDRFTGNFWFINPGRHDFIVSSLGLQKNEGDIIRMSELQGHFRFRSEIGIIRQLMGRFGDEYRKEGDLSNFVEALTRFTENPGSPEFQNYRSPREGSGFFILDLDLAFDD